MIKQLGVLGIILASLTLAQASTERDLYAEISEHVRECAAGAQASCSAVKNVREELRKQGECVREMEPNMRKFAFSKCSKAEMHDPTIPMQIEIDGVAYSFGFDDGSASIAFPMYVHGVSSHSGSDEIFNQFGFACRSDFGATFVVSLSGSFDELSGAVFLFYEGSKHPDMMELYRSERTSFGSKTRYIFSVDSERNDQIVKFVDNLLDGKPFRMQFFNPDDPDHPKEMKFYVDLIKKNDVRTLRRFCEL